MTFTTDQKTALEAPLNRQFVKPPAPGKYGDYVEGWHCIAEANRIFGFDGWTRETTLTLLGEPRSVDGKWRVEYMARVRITAGGVVRDGCGFGQGIDKDVGQAHESALKEAETDATKRSLMTFGNAFGLALYDKTQANVAEPPSPAVERAKAMLQEKAGLGAAPFKEFWESNKDAWRTGLTAQGYAEVVACMKELADGLKPRAVA